MPRNALIDDNVDLILGLQSVAATLAALVDGASIRSFVDSPGLRRPGPRHERVPRWVAPGHRLP